MKTSLSVAAIWVAIFSVVVVSSIAGPLPPSGERTCYDTKSEVPHPQPGRILFGAPKPADTPAPELIKLNETGNELPLESGTWVMVQDKTTGLVWEVKQRKDGKPDPANPHDADNLMRWYDPDSTTNGGVAGMPGTDTRCFLQTLNDQRFGGFSDWRLPTIYEIARLMDYHRFYPSISTFFFPDTFASFYWSSSSVGGYPQYAWGVYVSDGCDYFLDKNRYAGYAMAVRGKPSDPSWW